VKTQWSTRRSSPHGRSHVGTASDADCRAHERRAFEHVRVLCTRTARIWRVTPSVDHDSTSGNQRLAEQANCTHSTFRIAPSEIPPIRRREHNDNLEHSR
jgi:hypothetical protein